MSTKMTPELEAALVDLCDKMEMEVHLNTIEKVEMLLLETDIDHEYDSDILACIRDMRIISQKFKSVLAAVEVQG